MDRECSSSRGGSKVDSIRLWRRGMVPYEQAWEYQRRVAAGVREGRQEELILLQHPPVYTLGRRTRSEHLLVSADDLRARGADVVEVDRGGDVTFHGPGQLVAYPIFDLRQRSLGPVDYVRRLEEAVIRALARFEISGERVPGRPGVWAGGGKICAIGVRVQAGVSTHGFALNVDTDLAWFRAIVPCGLPDIVVTSMATVLGRAPAFSTVESAVMEAFEDVFDVHLEEQASSDVAAEAG